MNAKSDNFPYLQHSMIYFFHHYELPAILQQVRIQELLANPDIAAAGGEEEDGNDGPNPDQPEEREDNDGDGRGETQIDTDSSAATSAIQADEAVGNAGSDGGNQNESNGDGREGVRLRQQLGNRVRAGAGGGSGLMGLSDLFSVLRRTRLLQQQRDGTRGGRGATLVASRVGEQGTPVVMDNGRHQYEIERVTVYTESNIYRLFRRLRRRRDGQGAQIILTPGTSPEVQPSTNSSSNGVSTLPGQGAQIILTPGTSPEVQPSTNSSSNGVSTLPETPAAVPNTSENADRNDEGIEVASSLATAQSHLSCLKPETSTCLENSTQSEQSSGLGLEADCGSETSTAISSKNSSKNLNPAKLDSHVCDTDKDDILQESEAQNAVKIPTARDKVNTGSSLQDLPSQVSPACVNEDTGSYLCNVECEAMLARKPSTLTETVTIASDNICGSPVLSFQLGDAKLHNKLNPLASLSSLASSSSSHILESSADVNSQTSQMIAGGTLPSTKLSSLNSPAPSVPFTDLHPAHIGGKSVSASEDISRDSVSYKDNEIEKTMDSSGAAMRRNSYDCSEGTAV